MKELTKKQAKNFARIQSGLAIYNASGEELDGLGLSDLEEEMLLDFRRRECSKLLYLNEYKLSEVQQILDYVRTHF